MGFVKDDEVFIIAEIGGNHEGDFEYAKRLLLEAAKSGAHAVKFQSYKADKIVSKVEGAVRNEHFKKFELSDEQFIELAKLAEENGIMFMSSLWDKDAIEKLDPYLKVHKVGSGDLTNYPILDLLAKKDKPLIISTAMSTLDDVRGAVDYVRKVNPELVSRGDLVLLHCVAMYGDAREEYANLLAIKKLQNEFPGIHIGYSDHTKGVYACELSIAMGARVIEKHFTDDKTREFRDHHISADLGEMKSLVENSKRIVGLLGVYDKSPIEGIETADRIKEFRRAVYPSVDLNEGDILSDENLTTLRPNVGVDARRYDEILGKKLNKSKKAFEAIYDEDLE